MLSDEPINVLSYDANSDEWIFDTDAFRTVLEGEHLKNQPICVIAVVGKKRIGKSMLLNYCLRYLKRTPDCDEWLGPPDEPLKGFKSSSGHDTVTQGIWIWSEVFKIKNRNIALLLMDCEGLYGDGRDTNVTSRIFGITCALASHVIFNVHEMLSTDDLLNLNLFVSLGEFSVGKTSLNIDNGEVNVIARQTVNGKTFQHLTFLVRSWHFPNEYEYGLSDRYLHDKLRTTYSSDCSNIKTTKAAVSNAFEMIDCFLMPDPGSQLIYRKHFCGRHKVFSRDFKQYLKLFIEETLNNENILVKKIANQEVTCAKLIDVFEKIANKSNSFPLVPSIRSATVIAFESVVLFDFEKMYSEMVETSIYQNEYLNDTLLNDLHCVTKRALVAKFMAMDKFLNDHEEGNLIKKLDKTLDRKFAIVLDNYEVFVTKTRKQLLDKSLRSATIGFTGLAVAIAENFILVSETAGIFGIGALLSGLVMSVFHLWQWYETNDASAQIRALKKRFTR